MISTQKNSLLEWFFWIFVGLSTAGFDYEHFTAYKSVLIALSLIILGADFLRSGALKIPTPLIAFLIYSFCLFAFSLRDFDYWSGRIFFNFVAIFFASWAAGKLELTRSAVYLLIVISLTAFLYRFDEFFGGDGKPLVHDQVFLFTLSVFLLAKHLGDRGILLSYLFSMAFAFVGQIRSSLFSIAYVMVFRKVKSIWFLYLVVFLIYYFLFDYVYELGFFGFASSLTWRIYHWGELLAPHSFSNFVTGDGIGSVWRSSLDLRNFYSTGESYIDSHSFYIQLLVDSGIAGVLAFAVFFGYIYSRVDSWVREIAILFLAYGVFQGGVWQFSLVWVLLLSQDRNSYGKFQR